MLGLLKKRDGDMSQPNQSAELEELSAEARAKAIRETAQKCVEICGTPVAENCQLRVPYWDECARAIIAEFLSKEDGK